MIEEKNNPFDEFAEKYDNWFDTEEGRIIYKTEMNALKEIYIDNENSVEIGVGSGRFAAPLGVNFGIDTSFELIKYARFRNIKVAMAKGEDTPFFDNVFDTVLVVVTLCFLDEIEKTLNEVRRIIKEKGDLVIGFIPVSSEWGKLYKEQGKEGHKFYRYAKFYTTNEIIEYLLKTGFQMIDGVSTLFHPPFYTKEVETPRKGIFDEAGFVVIKAKRRINAEP